MLKNKPYHSKMWLKLTGAMTLFFLLPQQILASPLPQTTFSSAALKQSPQIQIPQEIGKIDGMAAPQAGAKWIFHIQNAHGNEEAQNNIGQLLEYLKSRYGVQTVLLEGGSGKLHPEILCFFPQDPKLNLRIADSLLKRSELTGAERFLLKDLQNNKTPLAGYGIENIPAYRENRRAFQKVLRAEEKSEVFLRQMHDQIQRLAGPALNPFLKAYLEKASDFALGRIDFLTWLDYLKLQASQHLKVDLENPFYQREYPMLIRIFRLRKITPQINRSQYEKEKTDWKKLIPKPHLAPSSTLGKKWSMRSASPSEGNAPSREREISEEKESSLSLSQRLFVLWGIIDFQGRPRIPVIVTYAVVATVAILSLGMIVGLLWR